MSIRDYFRPVSGWPANKVRHLLNDADPKEYNLVDVRTPKEYERRHLPGARLIPLGDLPKRLHELDPDKPTIVY